MGLTFNPLIYSGLDLSSTGGSPTPPPPGSYFILPPVATAADLPATATDGTIIVVKDKDTLYIYDLATTSWVPVNPPSTDLPQTTVTVTDSATDTAIPGFIFDASVLSAQAIVSVIDNTTNNQENISLLINKGATTPQRTESRVGDNTPVVFSVQNVGGQIQVFYKTTAGTNTYSITFRAFTVN